MQSRTQLKLATPKPPHDDIGSLWSAIQQKLGVRAAASCRATTAAIWVTTPGPDQDPFRRDSGEPSHSGHTEPLPARAALGSIQGKLQRPCSSGQLLSTHVYEPESVT